MQEILTFLKDNPVFYLATSINNHPYVRPFGAVSVHENRLYICTNNQKNVYQQMVHNPLVEICSTVIKNKYIRITANVELDQNIRAKEVMLEQNPILKSMYTIEDTAFTVFFLTNATACIVDNGNTKIIKF